MDKPDKAGQRQAAAQRLRSQYGLVGFFDILGYQPFLENNSARTAVEPVLNFLLNLEDSIPTNILQRWSDLVPESRTRERLHHCLKEVKWLIFSDTVLLTMNFDGLQFVMTHEVAFLSVCSCLWTTMFNFGLPLRGAITKGDFLIARTCFAGGAIIKAYNLQKGLNFAGVAIHPDEHELIRNTVPRELALPCQLPTNNGGCVDGYILTVPFGGGAAAHEPAWDGDLWQLVHECFCKHKKAINKDALNKVANTVRLLKFLKSRCPTRFQNAS